MSELYQFLDKRVSVQLGEFNKGLSLGNQNHSTGKLMRSPRPNDIYQAEQTNWTKENMHTHKNDDSRAHTGLIELNKFAQHYQQCSR
eukprot:12660075-Heterocapsa_arctica.AAC.1